MGLKIRGLDVDRLNKLGTKIYKKKNIRFLVVTSLGIKSKSSLNMAEKMVYYVFLVILEQIMNICARMDVIHIEPCSKKMVEM